MSDILPPHDCNSIIEVRQGVDHVDRRIVALLAERFAYMRAAARIKPERDQVRDEARKAQVIANAQVEADRVGAPVDVIGALWTQLVEASIAYEMGEFDRTKS